MMKYNIKVEIVSKVIGGKLIRPMRLLPPMVG
jgi:hypothetical protein